MRKQEEEDDDDMGDSSERSRFYNKLRTHIFWLRYTDVHMDIN